MLYVDSLSTQRKLAPLSHIHNKFSNTNIPLPPFSSFHQLNSETQLFVHTQQCSGSGYMCFWAARIRIRNYLDGSGSVHQPAKKCEKTLIFSCLSFLKNLSLKTDVNAPTVSIVIREKPIFVGILKATEEGSRNQIRISNPDPEYCKKPNIDTVLWQFF